MDRWCDTEEERRSPQIKSFSDDHFHEGPEILFFSRSKPMGHPLHALHEPSALKYCDLKGSRAFLRVRFTEGRGGRLLDEIET